MRLLILCKGSIIAIHARPLQGQCAPVYSNLYPFNTSDLPRSVWEGAWKDAAQLQRRPQTDQRGFLPRVMLAPLSSLPSHQPPTTG